MVPVRLFVAVVVVMEVADGGDYGRGSGGGIGSKSSVDERS